MLRVGLTGGIGSGKSAVARLLADRGAYVVDADRLAREVLRPGGAGFELVVREFGPQLVLPTGALDRARLAEVVFADPAARQRLEAIVHPLVRQAAADELRRLDRDRIVVEDVPLLVEAGLAGDYDVVVVVEAPAELRLARLAARGLPPADARARMAQQADDAARRAVADEILPNSGDLSQLAAAVDQLWTRLLARHRQADPDRSGPPGPAAGGAQRTTELGQG